MIWDNAFNGHFLYFGQRLSNGWLIKIIHKDFVNIILMNKQQCLKKQTISELMNGVPIKIKICNSTAMILIFWEVGRKQVFLFFTCGRRGSWAESDPKLGWVWNSYHSYLGPWDTFWCQYKQFGRLVWRESSFEVITFETHNWKLNFLDI